jgi:hypothetical protein
MLVTSLARKVQSRSGFGLRRVAILDGRTVDPALSAVLALPGCIIW